MRQTNCNYNHAGRVSRTASAKTRIFGVVLVLLLSAAFDASGYWRMCSAEAEPNDDATESLPTVRTVEAKANNKPIELNLPGQTNPFDQASIVARSTGYVAERFADIGTRVKQGDRLLRIAAPDLDRQLDQATAQLGQTAAALAQAQAQVDQATSTLKNSTTILTRDTDLLQRGYETAQDKDNQQTLVLSQQAMLETSQAGVKVAQANIDAQKATVARLRTLTDFENVIAPFDGVITTRNVDTGDLVNADSNSATPLFSMVRDDVLRVSVQVPQSAAILLQDGDKAKVTVSQLPGRTFAGRVNRSSEALYAASRSLNVEVDVENPNFELRAGLFVNVSFAIPRIKPAVTVPSDAIVFNQDGLQVAIVETGNVVHMQPITVYRDFGKSVELSEGLQGGEQVVLSPPALLAERSRVDVAQPDAGQEQAKR
jgi:HlyD family secretion protein